MSAKQVAISSIGRRKTASARVHLLPKSAEDAPAIEVNRKPVEEYFPEDTKRRVIFQPIQVTGTEDKFQFKVRVVGGGIAGQAEAVRHGIARALEKLDPELRPALKKAGLLTRDSRVVERKKPGRHKARKKPQFSKR